MRYYLVRVLGDVEPEILGPYSAEDHRDKTAKLLRDPENGLYWLDVNHKGIPKVGAYSAGFFMQDEVGEDPNSYSETYG